MMLDSQAIYSEITPCGILKPFPAGSIEAILTAVEGTTTSASFIYDFLLPYAKQNMSGYLHAHQNDASVISLIEAVKNISGDNTLDEVVLTLQTWMEENKTCKSLDALQMLLWEEGYERGDFQSHIYNDAFLELQRWSERGLAIYVYSSASAEAQKMLFFHAGQGDLTPVFSGYFDTNVGMKQEKASYLNIAEKMGCEPEKVLFLSDSIEELDAAREAGMKTILLCRDQESSCLCTHPYVINFYQIELP